MHRRLFTIAITGISRLCIVRDRMLGRIGPGGVSSSADAAVSRQKIRSGRNVVDTLFVTPAGRPAEAVVLICHGIGEVVERWFPVQRLLAANGAASLVFDYSGYGRSTGRVSAAQCEQDTIAAFELLQSLAPGHPITILGFSLGSGIAAAIVNRVPANRLVMCASFTSFRAAACSLGVPKRFAAAVPDIWHAAESLRDCSVPVLVVVLIALLGSMLVSYVRAKSEAMGLSLPGGLMRRHERIAYLTAGLLLGPVLHLASVPFEAPLTLLAVGVVAVVSNIAAVALTRAARAALVAQGRGPKGRA